MQDSDLAVELARAAGAVLLRLGRSGLWSGASLGRLGDEVSDAIIMAGLHAHRAEDGFLSEESRTDEGRLAHHRAWIVDPLDGSIEFGEGRDDWAVQIGLAIDGHAALGAIALPARGLVLRSDRSVQLRCCQQPPRLLVSRSHPPPAIAQIAAALGAVVIPMGSVGAKVAAILDGRGDAYVHYSGQYEWDSCAPVAIAQAAGLRVSRISGMPLVYNRPDPLLPDIMICHPALYDAMRQAVARVGGADSFRIE